MRPDILGEENSSYCRLEFSLNLMPLLDLTLMDLTTSLDLLSPDSCLAHLLVIFHCGHLRESSFAKLTAVRLLPSVTSHVALQAGGLKEAFATLVAEVGSLVVVLFPVKDRGISVCEFSSAIFTLVDLSHPVTRQVLLQVARGGKALFAELTLPGLVFVVHSIDVHSHVVASHEHLVTLWAGYAWCARILFLWRTAFFH